MKLTATVQNLPESINRYGWVVVRPCDGELWFYDAWHAEQEADAREQASEVNGLVLRVEG